MHPPNSFTLAQMKQELMDLKFKMLELERRIMQVEHPISEHLPGRFIGYANSHCQVCNLDLSKPIGYACGNAKCPVQPRITCSL